MYHKRRDNGGERFRTCGIMSGTGRAEEAKAEKTWASPQTEAHKAPAGTLATASRHSVEAFSTCDACARMVVGSCGHAKGGKSCDIGWRRQSNFRLAVCDFFFKKQ